MYEGLSDPYLKCVLGISFQDILTGSVHATYVAVSDSSYLMHLCGTSFCKPHMQASNASHRLVCWSVTVAAGRLLLQLDDVLHV